MLTFRNANLFFLALEVFSIGGWMRYGLSAYVGVIVAIAYVCILFWGCFNINSGFFMPVTCSLKTTEKVVALTFDDGPHHAHTPQLLQILEASHIEAAFFCIGRHIAENAALLKQTLDEGHLIGNHTYSHQFWFDMFGAGKMLADMQKMDEVTRQIIGKAPNLFRPPYGVINPNLKKAIIQGNYTPIGWNVRSLDTVIKDETKLLKRLKAGLKPGAIFLLHDTSTATISVLPELIKYIRANGYQIVRADKMLNLQPYA